MSNFFPRIKNYNVSVKESGNKIIFLRKLREGGSEHSFGIHVARMAGMPREVVERAGEILKKLEKEHEMELAIDSREKVNGTEKVRSKKEEEFQMSFFQLNDPVLEQIKADILKTDINTLTPVEALLRLNEIKRLVGG
jgi:DNA mismatch repair protein MutS